MAVNYERIGKRIQELRKLKKMSQADLAEHTGMSVSYISHIETLTVPHHGFWGDGGGIDPQHTEVLS